MKFKRHKSVEDLLKSHDIDETRREMERQMKNDIHIFEHEKFGEVRVIHEGDEVFFVAKDVVEKVGNKWKGMDSVRHVPECWRTVRSVWTVTGNKDTVCLSEQGVYFYLGRCDKPVAVRYQIMKTMGAQQATTVQHGRGKRMRNCLTCKWFEENQCAFPLPENIPMWVDPMDGYGIYEHDGKAWLDMDGLCADREITDCPAHAEKGEG